MTRRERRAAEKQRQSKHVGTDMPWPQIETPYPSFTDLNVVANTAAPSYDDASAPRPSLFMRALARLLLSNWVLKRVQHPDVERLLMSFAAETGRQEVVDELIRRQALRR